MAVTVYSKADCMQCNFTKNWLQNHNIPYKELKVDEQPTALAEVKSMGYQAVPVVVTDNDQWYGFQPDKLAKLVGE